MWTRAFGKSDSVVRVAMSQDDIGYVTRVISEALDLPYRGLSLIEVESGHFDEFTSDPLHRPLDILQANSGVNQHEAALILHQQTMAGNRSFSRTRPAAIDMAHAHHNATLTSQFAEPESRYNPRMPKLLRIAPELPVADVPGSIEYYRRALGFSSASIMPDEEYAIVERDGISVHLFRSQVRNAAASIHIFTDGLTELHAELAGRGANITQPIVRKPWGARDFRVLDNSGNELKFTELLSDD
jgi:uncharacterized glyoxalase superfamily protein PhnB